MVLPSYKLPQSLETIRSAPLSQGKSCLLPSRMVQGKKRREGTRALVVTALAKGGERWGRGLTETATPTGSHLAQVCKLSGGCGGNSQSTLQRQAAAAAGWSRAPRPHLWDRSPASLVRSTLPEKSPGIHLARLRSFRPPLPPQDPDRIL